MKLSLPCAIKECPHFVSVELADLDGNPMNSAAGFGICNECEAKIVIGTMVRMDKDGCFGEVPDVPKNFAITFNGWRRRRKGVTFMHGPGQIGQRPN